MENWKIDKWKKAYREILNTDYLDILEKMIGTHAIDKSNSRPRVYTLLKYHFDKEANLIGKVELLEDVSRDKYNPSKVFETENDVFVFYIELPEYWVPQSSLPKRDKDNNKIFNNKGELLYEVEKFQALEVLTEAIGSDPLSSLVNFDGNDDSCSSMIILQKYISWAN